MFGNLLICQEHWVLRFSEATAGWDAALRVAGGEERGAEEEPKRQREGPRRHRGPWMIDVLRTRPMSHTGDRVSALKLFFLFFFFSG